MLKKEYIFIKKEIITLLILSFFLGLGVKNILSNTSTNSNIDNYKQTFIPKQVVDIEKYASKDLLIDYGSNL